MSNNDLDKLRPFDDNEQPIHKQFARHTSLKSQIESLANIPFLHPGLYVITIIVLFYAPAFWPLCFCAILFEELWVKKNNKLLFNTPIGAGVEDRNSPIPGTKRKKFESAAGVGYLGNNMFNHEEIHQDFDTMLQHTFVWGTTGSGKTEYLLSVAYNYLAFSSGFMYGDAKADPGLAFQIYTIARMFGREDDFLTSNFLADGTVKSDPALRKSNDMSPFSFGSAAETTQMIKSLLPEEKGGGGNQVFSQAAHALVSALMPGLCELRDEGYMTLDPSVVRTYMEYEYFCLLIEHPQISETSKNPLVAFLSTRSGFDKAKAYNKQSEEVRKQYGFAQAYFTNVMSMMSDTYGYIYMTGRGEIDFKDIVLNNRIFVNLLPTLKFSSKEVEALSKINLACKKNTFAVALGSDLEGSREIIVQGSAANCDRPFADINDEFSYSAVSGYAAIAAQARGLKIALYFGAQEYKGIEEAIGAEASQILANQSTMIVGRIRDPKETTEIIQKTAGEGYVPVVEGMDNKGIYSRRNKTFRYEKKNRIEQSNLNSLNIGEMYVLSGGKMALMDVFWHKVTKDTVVPHLRVGKKLKVEIKVPQSPLFPVIRNENKHLAGHIDREWEYIDLSVLAGGDLSVNSNDIALSLLDLENPLSGCLYLRHLFDDISKDNTSGHLLYVSKAASDLKPAEDKLKQGILSNLGGDFGDTTGREESDAYIDSLFDVVKESQSGHPTGINASRNLEEMSTPEKNNIAEESHFANKIKIIASTVETLVVADTGDKTEALKAKKSIAKALATAADYPAENKPAADSAPKEELEDLLENFLNGIK